MNQKVILATLVCWDLLILSRDIFFQGCGISLNDAWLGRYKIDKNDLVKLSEFKKLITIETWDNRRPNEIIGMDNALYIGQEGALTKFKEGSYKFIFKSTPKNKSTDESLNGPESIPYTYVEAIWVNPEDEDHLIFGGGENNSEQEKMQLYVTCNCGETIYSWTDKLGYAAPYVKELIPFKDSVYLFLEDRSTRRAKLVALPENISPVVSL